MPAIVIGVILFCLWMALNSDESSHLTVVEIVPSNTGLPERCLSCHTGIESIGTSHPTSKFGCVSCHGGNRLALEVTSAHKDIVRNPSDLAVADKYCGSCHAAQTALVPHSLMATYSGAITLVRRMLGLQADGQAHFATTSIDSLAAFTVTANDPVPLQHFATNCTACHLRAAPIQQPYFYRSTGCATCHVLYNNDGLYKGNDPTIPKNVPGYPALHEITKQIPYTQCDHCHNRGNYDLKTMTFLPRTDEPPPQNLSADMRRLLDYYQPIGQFTQCEYKLDCIDCHTKLEVMGDGILHNNKADAQYIRCATCHGTTDSSLTQIAVSEAFAYATPSALLNPAASAVLMTEKGEVLPNIQFVNGDWILTSKIGGTSYKIPMVKGSKCQQKPDEQSSQSCHQCHSVDRSAVHSGSSP